jgi:hypothetical protein
MLPVNPMSLFAIMEEHVQLMSQIMEAEGEVTPEMEEALQLNGEQMQRKAMSVGYAVKTCEYSIEVLDKEIDRLQALKKRAAMAKEFFKQRLSEAMQLYGIERLEGGNIKLSFRKSTSVDVYEKLAIPEQYLEWKEPEVNKKRIAEALKAGDEVPGARLLTKQNLQIK